jgi:protein phosphatase
MTALWRVSWAGATDQGKIRSQNQDCFFGDPQGRYLILADGMGGHSSGEIASQTTVESVTGVLESFDWKQLPDAEKMVDRCVQTSAENLRKWVKAHPDDADLGTTLLIWIRKDNQIVLGSLGDSRIYLMRDKQLFQITCDQTIETELRRRGAGRAQALNTVGSSYLSRCILASRRCEPDIIQIESKPGDIWLLCSDGLTREVDTEVIEDILAANIDTSPQESVDALIRQALENGGRDNVTVVVARIDND